MSRETHVRFCEHLRGQFPRVTRLVLLTPTRNACNRALAACRDVLQRMRLALHPGKTRVQHAALPFRFLGQWLGSTPRLEWQPVTSAAAARAVTCC